MAIIQKSVSTLITLLLLLSVAPAHANTKQIESKQLSANTAAAEEEFPGRKKYPGVPYISIEQLKAEYDDVIIVDARSPYEYETLRVASAVNIPLSLGNSDYVSKLTLLREANPDKKIIFYCNGHTCMKSYKAAHRASVVAKIDNVYAFDAGIFEWTKANPDKAVLLGESPVDPGKLISKSDYKSRMLPALDFILKARDDVIVLDVRSRHQREGFDVFSGTEIRTSMQDKKSLKKYIDLAKKQNKKLFIYDAVGKQVRWLQYFLEANNAGPYYFMEGGAMAFFDVPTAALIDK
jgi:rhodanese-related sulfurtransferase